MVALAVVTGLLGAFIGLLDDRNGYRHSPRFETYLRERPSGAPSDPWDLPVVPEHDLGERLPDIEWREVRVVLGVGIATTLALLWLAPWHLVHVALSHVSLGWIAVVVVLVVADLPDRGRRGSWRPASPRTGVVAGSGRCWRRRSRRRSPDVCCPSTDRPAWPSTS